MNLKKNIKNISYLWIGSLLGSGSTFLIYILLARKLSPNEFGIFSSALSLLTIFILIGGFGISQFWLKIFGKEGWNAIRWIKPSLQFLFINILFITILISLWAFFGPHDDIYTKKVLIIMTIFVMGQIIIEIVGTKFQLEGKYLKLSIWQLLPSIFRLLLIIIGFALIKNLNILNIAIIYSVISSIFIFIGLYLLYNMNKGEIKLIGHKKERKQYRLKIKSKNIFFGSWPFCLSAVFSLIYLQSDIILIKYQLNNEEAAFYNVGFIILSIIIMFPTILYQKYLMPKIHRWANSDLNQLYNIYKKGNILMLILGLFFLIISLTINSYFIDLIFGKEYFKSIDITNTLCLSIPFIFIAYSVGSVLSTKEYIKTKIKIMGFIAIFNVLTNLIFIPLYGSIGAAWTTVMSNILLVLLYYIYAQKLIFSKRK
jgi:O-antigen/teichoic acid export membrane protein